MKIQLYETNKLLMIGILKAVESFPGFFHAVIVDEALGVNEITGCE